MAEKISLDHLRVAIESLDTPASRKLLNIEEHFVEGPEMELTRFRRQVFVSVL